MTRTQPRPEHPRPQFERDAWMNLNGPWTFETPPAPPFQPDRVDPAIAAIKGFADSITIPFAPESGLSGVGNKDFISTIRYHREIEIPDDWSDKIVLLHFGAVNYGCEVFIDGRRVGQHSGGSVSFTFNVTKFIHDGPTHDLVVSVRNDIWSGEQPSGKQSWKYDSYGCHYTRTTGIWQTVWLEAVHTLGLARLHIVPDADSGRFTLTPEFHSIPSGGRWQAEATIDGNACGSANASVSNGVPLILDISQPRIWGPGSPVLYEFQIRVFDADGRELDKVHSYGGLRNVSIEGNQFLINGSPFYQRLVLDQGFYPDGIWTAPSDDALRHDIELSMAAGFNGARLHQKVFEERLLYWADRLGYILWGESPSWGLDYCRDGMPHRNFLSEWREIVIRDRNHPSVVAWSPFNETGDFRDPKAHERLHLDALAICKSLDPSRPVNDSSGYIHHVTDLFTVHTYEQDPKRLSELLRDTPGRGVFRNFPEVDADYQGEPYIVDEFGGIKWDPSTQSDPLADGKNLVSWGYGEAPRSLEAFYVRLEGLVKALMANKQICGWCYTQLTDVEQEKNGIYFYDRGIKFDPERIRAIFTMPELSD